MNDDLPSPEHLTQRVRELLTAWRVRDPEVEVAWNGRLTTTAGRAFVRRGRVELNPHLLARAPDQVELVLTHEAAHVAAFRLFGANIPAHGRHWRSLMRLAGLPPEVTHRIPLDGIAPRRRRTRRRYLYLRLCDACGNRVVAPSVRYGRCHGCSSRDEFLVVKAPATAAGRQRLDALTPDEVRAHFR